MTTARPLAAAPHDPGIDQRKASDPSVCAWVNASAGSGKTKVLTDRVMRLLLSGVRPEKILCLTYTRAGAAEMANRITGMLAKWAVCNDPELSEDIDKLQNRPMDKDQLPTARRLFAEVLACPGGLRIRTIHSFCQEILSRFPLEAGLPPHFALIEEQELAVLKTEILNGMLREAADEPSGNLAKSLDALVAAQGETGFAKMLKEATHEIRRLTPAQNALKTMMAKTRSFLSIDETDTPDKIRRATIDAIPEATLRPMADWLSNGSTRYSPRGKKMRAFFELPPKNRLEHFDEYCGFFLKDDLTSFADSFIASKDIRAAHPEIDDLHKTEVQRLRSALQQIEAAEIAQTTKCVLYFGLEFSRRLAARKASRAAVDYDDLILFTENLLRKSGIAPWILYKLDNGLEHILLDESQDTSLAQWSIVESLTGEFFSGEGAQPERTRTLFVVGDEKQSIFSFQGADPQAFLSRRDYFLSRARAAQKTFENVSMQTSFRSAARVLEAVDAVFEQKAAQISPAPIAHRAYPNPDGTEKLGRVELWPLIEKPKAEKTSSTDWIPTTTRETEYDPETELTQAIAQKIKGWLTRRETLPGEPRPIAPGDIMILLRNRGRFASLMVRALKAIKVPVTGVDRMVLADQLPVMDLLSAIRFVLMPEDDLNLATLLRSPLIGLDEDKLMALAVNRDGSLWFALKADASLAPVRDYLSEKLAEADFSTPFAFLSNLLNAPCPANADSGRKALWVRLGDEAMDPIEELLNKAQLFGKSHSPSLQNFLRWLTQTNIEIKRELDRGEGRVRIMTVHASKGLEAPIVFLPDTISKPRSNDLPRFQWTEDGAPVFFPRPPRFGAAQRLWQAARARQMEEYNRLFYVAMTRASRRLYICGWQGGKKEDTSSSWYGLAEAALTPLKSETATTEPGGLEPKIVIADPVLAQSAKPHPEAAAPIRPPLPGWALQKAEDQQPSIPLAPSTATDLPAATPDSAFARGRIVHRLLQSLPDIPPARRPKAVAAYLSRPEFALPPDRQTEIANEVERLLQTEEFSALFSAESLAEAPLTGRIGDATVFRQIDRLCLQGDEVWIVDYKTNRPPPDREKDVPAAYRKQLEEYRILLKGIYPDKKVRSFLLWTYAPKLMEISG